MIRFDVVLDIFKRMLCPLVLGTIFSCCGPVDCSGNQPNIVLIYADDMGWGDLGANNVLSDVQTPNIDALAANGVRFTNGYVTAPQCAPSRSGLLTGMYQQRFGFELNIDGPLPLNETTIAERIRDQGYATGIAGKWHLTPAPSQREWIDANLNGDWTTHTEQDLAPYRSFNRGFTDAFEGELGDVWATYDLAGNTLAAPTELSFPDDYRIELQTQAALTFIDRHANSDPFFLYLPYFAPHVPLEAPQEYLDRFPGPMPERRRHALAMMSAVDDGVGDVVNRLAQYGLSDDTLVMFISDNGAPLALDLEDEPLDVNVNIWNGSLNTPFVGEKATLMEGGIRVPYVASWPGVLPQGTVYDHPVLQLDAAATALAAAGGSIESLDGKDLLPHLAQQNSDSPHDVMYWRMHAQEAVREGNWKLLRLTESRLQQDQTWLFDMAEAEPERTNLAGDNPEVVERLSGLLDAWIADLPRSQPPSPFPANILAFNEFLPTPMTSVRPDVVVDLGYDQAGAAPEVAFDPGSFSGADASGVRPGAGVAWDLRPGASISNSTPGGGAQAFADWDLPGGSPSLQNAIESEHYVEFDISLDGSDALAIEGLQIFGVAGATAADLFALFASNDGFTSSPASGDQLGVATFVRPYGDFEDPDFLVQRYLPVDFILDNPLIIPEEGATWTFRLYVREDSQDDTDPLVIDSIAYQVLKLHEGDFNRDAAVDVADLQIFGESFGAVGGPSGADLVFWQRGIQMFDNGASVAQLPVPEPSSLALLLALSAALQIGSRRRIT